MINPVILSVRLMTYNHEEYITQCLNSIEQQQTSFPFEVIIGDDFSTDSNIALIQQFIASSTNKNINYILLDRKKGDEYDINRQKKGRLYNFLDMISHCKRKYIALLDGDDYWTDPYKMQKQVDFLEANPNFNICFTQANTLKENKLELHPIPPISPNGIYTFDDLLEHYNFITTASVVFRKKFSKIPEWIYQLPYGDLGLYFLVSKDAKIKCLPEITSVYRIHEKGMWSGTNELKKVETQLKFYQVLFNQLNHHQKQLVKNKHKVLIAKISYQLHKKNRLLRVLKRIQLSNKYKL
ncbi:MAG: glycosyltransferase [Vicingaceae bacterium]|nr:glycosyltransferase [Vicingaceae bacterium]